MGREVKRVPKDFDWPMEMVWPGRMISMCGLIEDYNKNLPTKEICDLCRKYAALAGFETQQACGCPTFPFTEPPDGSWYQMWETVSEGSPISPAFATPEELAKYMATTRLGTDQGTSYETWLEFIVGPGCAPSMVIHGGEIMSGVEAVIKYK